MQRFLPVGKDAKGTARFLLAALPALGAGLTALAVTGDLVGRMARNHPWASFAAFGCAALAVFLGAVAAFALRERSGEERRGLYAGVRARAHPTSAGAAAARGHLGDVRAGPAPAASPQGAQLATAAGPVDDAARLRAGAWPAGAPSGGMVARARRRRCLRPPPRRGGGTRVHRCLRGRQHLEP